MRVALLLLIVSALIARPARTEAASNASGLDTGRIERLTGAKGTLDEPERAFKVSVPRTNFAITAAGVRMTPPLGLTSWAAFKRAVDHVMVMGDLVLLEDQWGVGRIEELARGLRAALDQTRHDSPSTK
jgi:hypothetical protein